MRDLVLHGPTGLLLDFGEVDFGGERQAAIVEEWRSRPANKTKAREGEFICHVHRDRERPSLYLRQARSTLVAAHWPGTALGDSHEITHGVSDEHKRQVEYISRAGTAAGFEVKAEVSLPTRVRSDAIIYGPTNTGVEVQRSALTVTAAKARTTKARRAGVLPIWFSDAHRDPQWIFKVPGVRMNEQPWSTIPRAGSVTVVSGVRLIIPQRCATIPHSPCPRRRHGCNRWHQTHWPRLGTTVDDLAALVPAGELVPIQYKTLTGPAYTFIVSRADKATYEALADISADLPLQQPERSIVAGERSACEADAGRIATCCSRRHPEAAGEPVVLACQLCPDSPTYWRHR
jgi:hypothetical protein